MNKYKLKRSERDMRNSMLKLMKSTPYGAITVTMLAGDAGINRKTFYAHYQNKDDLLHAMLFDMFDDMFGCFMYQKESPSNVLDEQLLQQDVRRFLETVQLYEEYVVVLITSETSDTALSIADQVVLNRCRDIHILSDQGGRIPRKFYLEIIRNFFMGIIDAWLETEDLSLEEGVTVLSKIIRQSYANIFRYVKPGLKTLTVSEQTKTP